MWQPIETAPKDGTAIIVYGQWAAEIGDWADDPPSVGVAYSNGTGWFSIHADYYSVTCDATHWMPLPNPPGHVADAGKADETVWICDEHGMRKSITAGPCVIEGNTVTSSNGVAIRVSNIELASNAIREFVRYTPISPTTIGPGLYELRFDDGDMNRAILVKID